jgi:glycosyltransferase involved in cell wall biosynthesis
LRLLQLGPISSLRRADGVIFLTEYAKTLVGQAARLTGWQPIISHGINEKFYLPPRSQKPLNAYTRQRPYKFLYVSKVEPYKHQWQVVEAVAKLWQAGLPVALDLIGGPENLPAVQQLSRALERFDTEADFVRYLGHVPYGELVNHYRRADGFVFASSCENLPNILLEAMAAGLPIACSDRGPMPEALGDAGCYFNPEDIPAKSKIVSLTLARRYGAAGKLPPIAAALSKAVAEVKQSDDGACHRREDACGHAVLVAQDTKSFEPTNIVLDVDSFLGDCSILFLLRWRQGAALGFLGGRRKRRESLSSHPHRRSENLPPHAASTPSSPRARTSRLRAATPRALALPCVLAD